MGILTINMSSYTAEPSDFSAHEYEDEILDTGWVPTLALQQTQLQGFENQPAIAESLANIDINVFLQKMYAYQR